MGVQEDQRLYQTITFQNPTAEPIVSPANKVAHRTRSLSKPQKQPKLTLPN